MPPLVVVAKAGLLVYTRLTVDRDSWSKGSEQIIEELD